MLFHTAIYPNSHYLRLIHSVVVDFVISKWLHLSGNNTFVCGQIMCSCIETIKEIIAIVTHGR
jgi:hypothetical protein